MTGIYLIILLSVHALVILLALDWRFLLKILFTQKARLPWFQKIMLSIPKIFTVTVQRAMTGILFFTSIYPLLPVIGIRIYGRLSGLFSIIVWVEPTNITWNTLMAILMKVLSGLILHRN